MKQNVIVVSTQRDGGEVVEGMSNIHTRTQSRYMCRRGNKTCCYGQPVFILKAMIHFSLYIYPVCREALFGRDSLNCLLKVDRRAAASSSVSGSLLSARGQLGKFLIYQKSKTTDSIE